MCRLLGFMFAANIFLRARLGQWWGMCVVAGVGYVVKELADQRFGDETSTVLSSLAIGLAGDIGFVFLFWTDCPFKVDVPNLVTYLNRTPIIEWYVVRCGSKNGYQKGIIRLKELGLHAQNHNHSMLKSQQNWGDLYDHLMSTTLFTLVMNKVIRWALNMMRKVATALIWICRPSSSNIS